MAWNWNHLIIYSKDKNRSFLQWVNELWFTPEAIFFHWHQSPHLLKWGGWTKWSLGSLLSLKILWVSKVFLSYWWFCIFYKGNSLESLKFYLHWEFDLKRGIMCRCLNWGNWSLIHFVLHMVTCPRSATLRHEWRI